MYSLVSLMKPWRLHHLPRLTFEVHKLSQNRLCFHEIMRITSANLATYQHGKENPCLYSDCKNFEGQGNFTSDSECSIEKLSLDSDVHQHLNHHTFSKHVPITYSSSTHFGPGYHVLQVRKFSTSSALCGQSKRQSRGSFAKVKVPTVRGWSRFVSRGKLVDQTKQKLSRRMTSLGYSLSSQNEALKDRLKVHKKSGEEAVHRMRRKIAVKKENIKTIPNLLTTIRMGSAPVLAYLVLTESFLPAFSIFVVAGLTDMLDGYIARNFKNQRTALGTALDPLADKLLMSFLTISLTCVDLVPVPLTVLILGRDAGLIAGSFYIRYISLSPPRTLSRYFDVSHVTAKLYPSAISKANTLIQLSYVALTLAAPVFDFVGHPWLQALMYTTAATTFLSGADYVFTWRKRLKIVKNN